MSAKIGVQYSSCERVDLFDEGSLINKRSFEEVSDTSTLQEDEGGDILPGQPTTSEPSARKIAFLCLPSETDAEQLQCIRSTKTPREQLPLFIKAYLSCEPFRRFMSQNQISSPSEALLFSDHTTHELRAWVDSLLPSLSNYLITIYAHSKGISVETLKDLFHRGTPLPEYSNRKLFDEALQVAKIWRRLKTLIEKQSDLEELSQQLECLAISR